MDNLKNYLYKNFEQVLVLVLLVSIALINYFVVHKIALLNLYFLPVLVAGYILGKRSACLVSVLCTLLVIFYYMFYPDSYAIGTGKASTIIHLLTWSCFLVLAGSLVGYLYELKEEKIKELRAAYIGVLEILSKYLEAADIYTKGHSVRVANYSADIAMAMGVLPPDVEIIKAAALLHDIGKIEISTDILQKAATLDEKERETMKTHTDKAAKIIKSVGWILRETVPIVLAHHEYFAQKDSMGISASKDIPLGARILAVADSFDAMTTDRPYKAGIPPWKAIHELRSLSGVQFDPEVVETFSMVLTKQVGSHKMLSGTYP